jgi:hypothetical protein
LHVAQVSGQDHHAIAHVAIEGEVGRQCDQAGIARELTHLEVRRPHLDAHGLSLVTAGNGATVVVGQHDYRPALQSGLEDAFVGGVKVVAVDEGGHGGAGYCRNEQNKDEARY